MKCEQNQVGAVTVLAPKGALVQQDADAFSQVLGEGIGQSFGRLLVDFSGVPYIDSRCLEVLVEATEGLSKSGQTLKLCGVNDLVREVLELTQIDSMFELYADTNAGARSYL